VAFPPERVDTLAAAFDQAEARGRDALYQAWLGKDDGERFGRDFRSLYIELEEALQTLMRSDRDAGRECDASQCWTPPAVETGLDAEAGEESDRADTLEARTAS
jgi:hypothetical protein